jgi:hypothetical protein
VELETAFDLHQTEVNADPAAVKEARRRRDLFGEALAPEDDVTESFPSGSLARGSQIEPIHDVDFVVVYDPEAHPDWGSPGASAEDALGHVGGQVNELLGATNGTVAKEVRLAIPRNHAVKCFLDDPNDPDAFTVDVMPALRQADNTLLIPESRNRTWVLADPQDLIRRVADRHAAWNQFVRLVRVLKHWNKNEKAGMKSLVVEVLALHHLPVGFRPEALQRFFTAAAVAVGLPVTDPAGLCGEIQPDLDRAHARARLEAAADVAWQARAAEARGDTDEGICLWRQVLGPAFPEPPTGCASADAGPIAVPAVLVRPRPVRDAPQG